MSYGLNIVVVGTGMYVCGRGTEGDGTIIPAIIEWKRLGNSGKVRVVGTDPKGARAAHKKIANMCRKAGIHISYDVLPKGRDADTRAYIKAFRDTPKPACAIIAVPDHLHRKVAEAAIRSGLHTLVVKPLVPTVSEANRLIRLQKQKKVYCAVEFHKRLDVANLKLRDVIARNAIGDPLYFIVEYSQRKSVPTRHFIKWVEMTNIFQYLGVHYIDIIYFVTGALPKRAMATGQQNWLRSKGLNTYDSIEAVVEWEIPGKKRFVSHLFTNWIDPESTTSMSDQKIKVIGTTGRFESDQKRRGISIISDDNGAQEPNPYFSAEYGAEGAVSYGGYGIDSVKQFLEDAVGVDSGTIKIGDLEKARPTFRQALVSTAVLEAVNESLKHDGKWITVKRGAHE